MSSNTPNDPKPSLGQQAVSAPNQLPEKKVETKQERFTRLDQTARRGITFSFGAGYALLEIREGKLWREGSFESWNHYCESFLEASRGHINRLIRHAAVYAELWKQGPPVDAVGNAILPKGESQTRPLLKLSEGKQQALAWHNAVKSADGLPTAKIVEQAVAEIIGEAPPKAQKPRAKKRLEVIKKLKAAVRSRDSWDRIEELIKILEKIETPKTRTK
jgi:hypothetical protein